MNFSYRLFFKNKICLESFFSTLLSVVNGTIKCFWIFFSSAMAILKSLFAFTNQAKYAVALERLSSCIQHHSFLFYFGTQRHFVFQALLEFFFCVDKKIFRCAKTPQDVKTYVLPFISSLIRLFNYDKQVKVAIVVWVAPGVRAKKIDCHRIVCFDQSIFNFFYCFFIYHKNPQF